MGGNYETTTGLCKTAETKEEGIFEVTERIKKTNLECSNVANGILTTLAGPSPQEAKDENPRTEEASACFVNNIGILIKQLNLICRQQENLCKILEKVNVALFSQMERF